ncbi:hypothetical protein LCGC14_2024660 [marine sediment metagenome]|uniref:Uncharacterized protein n=1 Tax=marine sediment metagenome TaxID=412755 RepID=A0A0F9H9U8_9ZZZZ|nr:hypothetical protein [bacterium]
MNKVIIDPSGWHIAGQNHKLHFLIGKQEDNCGWVTLCNTLVNGVSSNNINHIYKDYRCKSCTKRLGGKKI